MKHCRTWISRHRHDQKDITCLCLHMATILAFHLVMRQILIFSMVTLKIPNRLSMTSESLPYQVHNGVIVICCLILTCSLIHLIGAIRRPRAIRLIAISLVVSSCCLIANGMILRTILKSADPRVIANLSPETVIIDIDRRGWLTFEDMPLLQPSLNRIIESRLEECSSFPLIICADGRTRCRIVWELVNSLREIGATDISVANQWGLDYYNAPALREGSVPSDTPTNVVTSVSIHPHYFRLNGRRIGNRLMAGEMSEHVESRPGDWYRITVDANASHQGVTLLLKAFQEYGATNLVWELSR
jgi:biopolymer transport protein ExbD